MTPKLLVIEVILPKMYSGMIAWPADRNKIFANPTDNQLKPNKIINI